MNTSTSQPPEILRILAHPLRWQLVHVLSNSDLRVQELVGLLQQPYNLVSYHLKLLREAELVRLRKSDADGRDLYYHLDQEKLQADYQAARLAIGSGWKNVEVFRRLPLHPPLRVLFLCTHNSARSQMAEGFLRQLGGENFQVSSAGSQPQDVHPEAIHVMAGFGIDITHQRSRHLNELLPQSFDVAITVCDRVREECMLFNLCPVHLHWSLPDPAEYLDPGERHQAFLRTAQELHSRIQQFITNQSSIISPEKV